MDMRRSRWNRVWIALLLGLFLASGCGAVRSEFFRGEIVHLLEKGNRHYRSGEFKEAKACYEEAVGLDPACAGGHAALGNIAYVRGAFYEAAARYERALALAPDLEEALAPLHLDALRMQEQEELTAQGADLHKILELLLAGMEAEVEALLQKEVSAAMLVRHMTSLSSGDRNQLLKLAKERACTGTVPPRCALLYGHLLAVDERHGFLAARLLESAARNLKGQAGQKAWMTLAALYIRLGRESDAAWAYEAALDAGCPEDEVVPLIARLYGMPASAVASNEDGESGEPEPSRDASPALLSAGTLSGSLDSPPKPQGSPAAASHATGAEANRAVVVRPAPSSVHPPAERKGQPQ